jgi:hypothetical protein
MIDHTVGYGFHIAASKVILSACESQDNCNHGFFFDSHDIIGAGLNSDSMV